MVTAAVHQLPRLSRQRGMDECQVALVHTGGGRRIEDHRLLPVQGGFIGFQYIPMGPFLPVAAIFAGYGTGTAPAHDSDSTGATLVFPLFFLFHKIIALFTDNIYGITIRNASIPKL